MILTFLLALGCKKSTEPVAPASEDLCSRPAGMFGPVQLADGMRRYGEGATVLSAAPTSRTQPIEVCAVRGQLEWLTSVTCSDGTRPFANGQEAHSARVGNVGTGGRCGSVIDLYAVPCPRGTVEVYMDLYMCREGEAF